MSAGGMYAVENASAQQIEHTTRPFASGVRSQTSAAVRRRSGAAVVSLRRPPARYQFVTLARAVAAGI